MRELMKKSIDEKIWLLNQLYNCDYLEEMEKSAESLAECLGKGHKILLAGNGGSAADAQHFAGEMVGRFMMERKSLPAISLCTDSSVLTCIANDYGYSKVFARQIEGLAEKGDALVVISTSGNSENLLEAAQAANKKEMTVIGFLGKDGGKLKAYCNYTLLVPSDVIPRIQEVHTFTVHMICEYVEKKLFYC